MAAGMMSGSTALEAFAEPLSLDLLSGAWEFALAQAHSQPPLVTLTI